MHNKFSPGKSEIPILTIILGLGLVLAGGLLSGYHPTYDKAATQGLCCDTGDGDQCKPQTNPGQTLMFSSPTSYTYPQYKGVPQQYDLLKSNIRITECFKHGMDSKQTVTYADGTVHPIIYNNSQELAGTAGECRDSGYDQIADFRSGTKTCAEIPDDELIYVCVANCEAPYGNTQKSSSCPAAPYGNATTTYDIYFRDKDYPNPGIPDVIKNCNQGANIPSGGVTPSTVVTNTYNSHSSLQLHWFLFKGGGQQLLEPRPFCKPAIYLYPPKEESVTVQVAPKGKINLTIPTYPINGWKVTADPSGNIRYNSHNYDYLFYEAQISDSLIPQPNSGYVVAYDELSQFFTTLLPQLGLNSKEQQQFSDYWLKALPKNPYYQVSLLPESLLNTISPLTISPTPDTILRIDMYFQPLDKKINLTTPALPHIDRTGFTVVEWGGLFKQDKNHPFTCLM